MRDDPNIDKRINPESSQKSRLPTSKMLSYIVMPRLGVNLYDLFMERNKMFSRMQIYSLGIQLVNILEQVHSAGFVYNDLKLDNLMLSHGLDACDL